MASDCHIGVGLDYVVVVVVVCVCVFLCVCIFLGVGVCGGGSFFVPEYLKFLGISGFIFPVSNCCV